MATRIKLRRDTADKWVSVNPVLSAGEVGVDLTSGTMRVGDGSSAWVDLPVSVTDARIGVVGGVAALDAEGVPVDADGRQMLAAEDAPSVAAESITAADTGGILGSAPGDFLSPAEANAAYASFDYVEERALELLDGMVPVSGPDVSGKGDSLTAGAGGDGTSWPSALADILAAYASPGTVQNLGVGGETPATIAGRAMLGSPWLATFSGGEIPASGAATVTLLSATGDAVAPLVQGSSGVNPVEIEGISGTLSLAAGVYSFTRAAAGETVALAGPAEVVTAAQRLRQADLDVIWIGQNGDQDVEKIIGYQRPAIKRLKALTKRWLVLGLSTGTDSSRAAMDARFLSEYGDRFVNVRDYLSSQSALLREGIAPTADDLSKISVGSVPSSLLSNPGGGDFTHLNAAGYRRVARLLYDTIVGLGWNDQWGELEGDDSDNPEPTAIDDFARTSTNLNGAAAAYGGGTWLVLSGGNAVASIDSGALRMTLNGDGECIARLLASSTDARMVATLKTRGAGAAYMRLRYSNPSNYLRFYCLADGIWKLGSVVAGSSTVIADNLGNAADGDEIDVTLVGTAVVVKINGVQVYSGTVPTFGSNPAAFGFSANSTSEAQRWESVYLYAA